MTKNKQHPAGTTRRPGLYNEGSGRLQSNDKVHGQRDYRADTAAAADAAGTRQTSQYSYLEHY